MGKLSKLNDEKRKAKQDFCIIVCNNEYTISVK